MGSETIEVVPGLNSAAAIQRSQHLSASFGGPVECHARYQGKVAGVEAMETLDWLHYLSAGAVSFARGLNDTPKIAALLLVAPSLGALGSTAAVGTLIAVGGLLSARKVADVMSRRITSMNHGQGFTSNLVTALIVIGASRWGMPVSTTHVSCGALFGIGTVTHQARWGVIGTILVAWVTTLPAAAVLGTLSYWAIRRF